MGVQNLDVDPQKEIVVRNPDVLRGRLLRGNDVLVSDNLGLSDCELMSPVRQRHIVNTYKFKDAIIQHTGRWIPRLSGFQGIVLSLSARF